MLATTRSIIMLVDVFITFFTAIPKDVRVTLSDSHDDPMIRKRERAGLKKRSTLIPGIKSKKKTTRANAEKIEHPTFTFKFSKIAIKYLSTSFFIDIIACLPILVYEAKDLFDSSNRTVLRYLEDDKYWYINWLSLLRITMLYKIFASLMLVFRMLRHKYFMKRILIENAKNIFIRCF